MPIMSWLRLYEFTVLPHRTTKYLSLVAYDLVGNADGDIYLAEADATITATSSHGIILMRLESSMPLMLCLRWTLW
jgi:hypothetical protein